MHRTQQWPLHPALLGTNWVLATLVGTGAHLLSTMRAFGVVMLGVGAVVAVLWLLTRSRHRAAAVATILVIPLVSAHPDQFGLTVAAIAAPIALLMVLQAIRGRPLMGMQVTGGLNLVTAVLLAMTVVRGVTNGAIPAALSDPFAGPPDIGSLDDNASGPSPDIYLIQLDGYPREDVMREVLREDNLEFLEALAARGFEVAERSHAGYMYTELTLTSLFHGRHVVDIGALEPLFDGENYPALGRTVLNQAPLLTVLASHGYTVITNAQAWDEPALRRAHRRMEGTGLNEFERELFLSSLVGNVWELVDPGLRQSLMQTWVNDAFEFLEESPRMAASGPRFVFIHVPSPHLPIVFKADGSRADPRFAATHPDQIAVPAEVLADAYMGQVEYLNSRLIGTLDAMHLPEDAVVVLFSDHGPEFGLVWTDGPASDLRTRFATLFAARSPCFAFPDDLGVESVLARLIVGLLGEELPIPAAQFFASSAVPKYQTLEEVPDPWASEHSPGSPSGAGEPAVRVRVHPVRDQGSVSGAGTCRPSRGASTHSWYQALATDPYPDTR